MRSRREEIPILWRAFLLESGGADVVYENLIDELLIEREWRGNVRELWNLANACVALAECQVITADVVSWCFSGNAAMARRSPRMTAANERMQQATRVIQEFGRISRRQYAKALGVSSRSALRDLSRMTELGLVRRRGLGRGTVYVLEGNSGLGEDVRSP